jgi:hypothetical protein
MKKFFRWFKSLFRKKRPFPYFLTIDSTSPVIVQASFGENSPIESPRVDNRLEVKPIEVMHELEKPVAFDTDNLKEIEKKLEARISVFEKMGASADSETLRALSICRARMKYPKVADAFHWKTTVDSKIKDLTSKYKLEHRSVSDFIKKMPTEAVEVMTEYTLLYGKVTAESPSFTIIAPASSFKQRDPILLAKSPFGQYYYILCAWDKEVEYVSDLLSEEKLEMQ